MRERHLPRQASHPRGQLGGESGFSAQGSRFWHRVYKKWGVYRRRMFCEISLVHTATTAGEQRT